MLVENIFGIPVWGWILFGLVGTCFVALWILRRRSRKEPLEEHMDYFCCCYARGEISKEDFEELKEDLNHYLHSIGKKNGKHYRQDSKESST